MDTIFIQRAESRFEVFGHYLVNERNEEKKVKGKKGE